jgi:hypothetical protein
MISDRIYIEVNNAIKHNSSLTTPLKDLDAKKHISYVKKCFNV